jgi:hypothetical protein
MKNKQYLFFSKYFKIIKKNKFKKEVINILNQKITTLAK